MAAPAVTVDRDVQRFTSNAQPEPDVCVLHTTEGMSWPGYSGGGEAPHATIEAVPSVGIKVREHIPWLQNAKALVNLPGGVETNRRGALQFELMGTCDPKHRNDPDWFYWPDADDVVLAALADYLRPILARFAIPFAGPTFQAYSASYGSLGRTNTVRFTNAQWLAFQGICGHQHVPENVHGDPGAFPIAKLIAFLRGGMPASKEFDVADAQDAAVLWTAPLTKKGSIKPPAENESPLAILARVARNVETIGLLVKAQGSAAEIAAAVVAALPVGAAIPDVDALAKAIVVELGKD